MSEFPTDLTPELYQYVEQVSLRQSAAQKALEAETVKQDMRIMKTSNVQAQFLRFWIETMQAKTVIEVGTFTGYGALSMAEGLPAGGKIICCDTSEEWTNVGKKHWEEAGFGQTIELRIGPASDTLIQLADEGFLLGKVDFIFVDADKPAYDDYYEKSLPLLRTGGVIAFDNVFLGGDVVDPTNNRPRTEAMRALNEKLLNDERVSISMLTIADGLTLARKR